MKEMPIRLVPPRPNLDPEAWVEASNGIDSRLLAIGIAAAAIGLVGFWWQSRRRRRQSAESADAITTPDEASPREQWIAWAEGIRRRIVERCGPETAARTTEEWASAADLAEQFGRDGAARLLGLFALVDRAKFAAPESWDELAETVATIAPADIAAILAKQA